jgi:hypothetical protein
MHNACGDFEASVQSRTQEFDMNFAKMCRQLHSKETIDNRYVNVELSHAIAVTSQKKKQTSLASDLPESNARLVPACLLLSH